MEVLHDFFVGDVRRPVSKRFFDTCPEPFLIARLRFTHNLPPRREDIVFRPSIRFVEKALKKPVKIAGSNWRASSKISAAVRLRVGLYRETGSAPTLRNALRHGFAGGLPEIEAAVLGMAVDLL